MRGRRVGSSRRSWRSGSPVLGNRSTALDVLAAEPGSPCAFGLAGSSQPISIGVCAFFLSAPLVCVPGQCSRVGIATLSLGIPSNSALVGATLWGQAVGVRPAPAPPVLWRTPARALTLAG